MPDFDIIMIGNFAKDKIIVDGVEQIMSGSGVYFGSVVIRRLGLKVAVVTRLHPSDFHRLDEIRAEGVEVFANQRRAPPGLPIIMIQKTWSAASASRSALAASMQWNRSLI